MMGREDVTILHQAAKSLGVKSRCKESRRRGSPWTMSHQHRPVMAGKAHGEGAGPRLLHLLTLHF